MIDIELNIIPKLIPGKIYNLIDNATFGNRHIIFSNAIYVGTTKQRYHGTNECWYPYTFLVNKKLEYFGEEDFEYFDIEEVK